MNVHRFFGEMRIRGKICTAGAGGGLVASIATCPLDVVKTKLQAQRAAVGQAGYLGVTGVPLEHIPTFLSEN